MWFFRRSFVFKNFESICLFLGAIYLALSLRKDWVRGGNGWRQGDWLINSNVSFVRRGELGSAILWMSDFFSLNPLSIVVVIQLILLILFVACLFLFVSGIDLKRYFYILLFSPSFCLIFWVGDPQGAFRKEIILYVAMLVIGLSIVWKRKGFLYLGVLLAIVGVLGHEINFLLLPAFLFCIFCAYKSGLLSRGDVFLVAVVACCLIIFIGIKFFVVGYDATPESVCGPLLERGLDKHLCDGAISWIGKSSAAGRISVLNMLHDARWESVVGFCFSYFVSFLFFLKFLTLFDDKKTLVVIYVGCFFMVFPLYFVAVDWGRWMSAHTTSASLCVLCYIASGNIKKSKLNIENPSLKFWSFSPLFVLPNHSLGMQPFRLAGFYIFFLFLLLSVEVVVEFLYGQLRRLRSF